MSDKKLIIFPKQFRGKSVVISVRLPKDMVEAVDAIVKRTGRNRNEVIQKCLIFALNNLEIED